MTASKDEYDMTMTESVGPHNYKLEPVLYFHCTAASVEEALEFLREHVDPTIRFRATANPDSLLLEFGCELFRALSEVPVYLRYETLLEKEDMDWLCDSILLSSVSVPRTTIVPIRICSDLELDALYRLACLLGSFGTMFLTEDADIMMATPDIIVSKDDRSVHFYRSFK